MLKNLNKEIIIKKTLKQKLLETLCSSVLWSLFLYFCLTEFNELIVSVFNEIAENNSAIEFVLILFPIIIILGIMITLANFVIYESKKK